MSLSNTVIHGDCVNAMAGMAPASVDFILTDPPYCVRYRDRSGRSIANDNNTAWLEPAFAQMYRVLKPGSFAVSFYGWNKVHWFAQAWTAAGFRMVGHIVFRKDYDLSVSFFRHQHEQAYLLAKGEVDLPQLKLPDVIDFDYTANRFHPTQKPVSALRPLVKAFCKPDGVVLDPFCGSGSTLVAARDLGRGFIGIELDRRHHETASRRVTG